MLSGTSCKKGQFDGRYQTIFGFKLPTINPYSSLFWGALYARVPSSFTFLKQEESYTISLQYKVVQFFKSLCRGRAI